MSAKQHLKELQIRLTVVAVFFVIGATLAYMYQDTLIPFLLAPIGQEKLVYLNPAGGFSFIFLVSIYAGIAVAFPVIIQQIYAFLRPALPEKAHKRSSVIIIGSSFLLLAGIVFGYYVAVPSALQFLYGFADKYVEASLTADSYLNFVIAYTIGIGLVFQIPLLLLLLHAVKPLTPGGLMRSERWVVLFAFIIAAIITPTPDPVNQAIIAGPVIIVYQIGVIIILTSILRQRQVAKKEQRRIRRQQNAPVYQAVPAFTQTAPPAALEPLVAAVSPQALQHPVRHLTMDGIARPRGQVAARPLTRAVQSQQVSTSPQTHHPQPAHTQAKPMPNPIGTVRSIDGMRPITRGKVQPSLRALTQKVDRPQLSRGFSIDGISPRRVSTY